jgi:hypothetical protein
MNFALPCAVAPNAEAEGKESDAKMKTGAGIKFGRLVAHGNRTSE